MTDRLSPSARSLNMAAVKGKNTKPEMVVRRLAHRLGYRFRLHRRDLPGKPDLAFISQSKVIFVHGCFWHRHPGCTRATIPQTNAEFWELKLARNVERDRIACGALISSGWQVLVIWECETKDIAHLENILRSFLENSQDLL